MGTEKKCSPLSKMKLYPAAFLLLLLAVSCKAEIEEIIAAGHEDNISDLCRAGSECDGCGNIARGGEDLVRVCCEGCINVQAVFKGKLTECKCNKSGSSHAISHAQA